MKKTGHGTDNIYIAGVIFIRNKYNDLPSKTSTVKACKLVRGDISKQLPIDNINAVF